MLFRTVILGALIPSALGALMILGSFAVAPFSKRKPGMQQPLSLGMRVSGIVLFPGSFVLGSIAAVSVIPGAPVEARVILYVLFCGIAALLLLKVSPGSLLRWFQDSFARGGLVPVDESWRRAVVVSLRSLGGSFAVFAVAALLSFLASGT